MTSLSLFELCFFKLPGEDFSKQFFSKSTSCSSSHHKQSHGEFPGCYFRIHGEYPGFTLENFGIPGEFFEFHWCIQLLFIYHSFSLMKKTKSGMEDEANTLPSLSFSYLFLLDWLCGKKENLAINVFWKFEYILVLVQHGSFRFRKPMETHKIWVHTFETISTNSRRISMLISFSNIR